MVDFVSVAPASRATSTATAAPKKSMGSSSSKTYTPPAIKTTLHTQDYVKSLADMTGKTCAITGASTTNGLGWRCAETLARRGARIILLNRPSDRAVAAEKALKEAVSGVDVSTIDCDLSSFEGARSAAAALREMIGESGLDVLCNNAAVMALKDTATVDGYDTQMQTNHLSHFLLCREVFPLLERAAELRGEARIVSHSSSARHLGRRIQARYLQKNGGDLGGNSSSMLCGGARWARYGQSKLANVLFTLALRDRLAARGSKVIAACAAPGLAATNLQATTHADGGMADAWFMRFAASPEDGAMSLINCCAMASTKNGDHIEPGIIKGKPHLFFPEKEGLVGSGDVSLLWQESERAVGPWAL